MLMVWNRCELTSCFTMEECRDITSRLLGESDRVHRENDQQKFSVSPQQRNKTVLRHPV